MDPFSRKRLTVALGFVAVSALFAQEPAAPAAQPPRYVSGTAYHILPETHSDESGYFSLCEGKNGNIYVGTAKYGQNSYLVEFNPGTAKQRIVIDTHKLCGLTNSGYAAQAKIHTRNYVGPSGRIYVGSKQGYRRGPDDTAPYPGGHVMVYDPAKDEAEDLGMPYPGEGVIDVAADESRGLIYVVTCESQHWMLYDMKTRTYRELGPLLAAYMTTQVDVNGRAHAITADFRLATYDPAADTVVVRDLVAASRKLTREDLASGPVCWYPTPDNRTAYLIRLSDPSLFRIDLAGEGEPVAAVDLGPMIAGSGFDSRGSLCVGPSGRVYAVIRVNNETGFGSGYLHHLVRYDPERNTMEDLGVLAVRNPDFFGPPLDAGGAVDAATGTTKAWTHGFHKLPDGTLTPLHAHMACCVARDGTVYVTIIYPFTLLRIPTIDG